MCGTKYSVEEAKKMMIEGKVDVSGSTVKVDNSASIENYFKMAENAYESRNNSETEQYCNKIIEINPQYYKAWLLKGKAAGWQSTVADLRIEESVNCFTKALENAPEDIKSNIQKEASEEIEKLSFAVLSQCCDYFEKRPVKTNRDYIIRYVTLTQLYSIELLRKCGVTADGFKDSVATKINNSALNAYFSKLEHDYSRTVSHTDFDNQQYIEGVFYVIELIENSISLCSDAGECDIARYKNIIDIKTRYLRNMKKVLTSIAYNENVDKIMNYHQKIKSIDPNYVIPKRSTYKKGCYVATCVYGSYECPEVWTLRRFRDDKLAKTWYGRIFIYTYYAVSPTLVKWFGDTKWFKRMWKGKLDRIVINLQKKGYESTPYNDRDW